MNTLQTRLELQLAIQQRIDDFINEYNISPSMMDDALSKVLLNVRELALREFLLAAQASSTQREDVREVPNEQNNYDEMEQSRE